MMSWWRRYRVYVMDTRDVASAAWVYLDTVEGSSKGDVEERVGDRLPYGVWVHAVDEYSPYDPTVRFV